MSIINKFLQRTIHLSVKNLHSTKLSKDVYYEGVIIRSGYGLGSILAINASWSKDPDFVWATIHGLLGWFYVIYFTYNYPYNFRISD